MKICITVPANKPIKSRTVQSLLDVVANSYGEFLIIIADAGYTPSEKRNYAIVQSLNANCDYTFFVDDDMVFPKDTLTKLIQDDKDVVGALYYKRGLPLEKVIEGEVSEGVFKCQSIGAGLFLAKNSIFMKMRKPWFDTKVDGIGQTVVGDSFRFCDLVRDAGFEVWCDSTLNIGHIGEIIYENTDRDIIK
jgi:hypothetical protein